MLPDHKYSLPAGIRLRHYVIERLLGHGGFGLTYLAEDTHLSRKVAIKELLPIDFAVRGKRRHDRRAEKPGRPAQF